MPIFSKKNSSNIFSTLCTWLKFANSCSESKRNSYFFIWCGEGGKPNLGGFSIATAQARGVLEQEFKKDGINVKWLFFPGACPQPMRL